jgi:hypothetical protein
VTARNPVCPAVRDHTPAVPHPASEKQVGKEVPSSSDGLTTRFEPTLVAANTSEAVEVMKPATRHTTTMRACTLDGDLRCPADRNPLFLRTELNRKWTKPDGERLNTVPPKLQLQISRKDVLTALLSDGLRRLRCAGNPVDTLRYVLGNHSRKCDLAEEATGHPLW